jgi:pyruvate dehydrogenase E1 component beta subunit
METDPSVYIMGLGVTDPKGVFGTTLGLEKKFGSKRVLDMPVSENGMTGIAIGSALVGMRPILTHQRVDFMLLSLDQIINNAAKWHYMFGGKMKVPLVIRLLVGRGWGQGPQHSQSLQAIFAHIPGLKVVMPATPYDAKGLLISAVEDDNPVIFIEHRWLHNISGDVSEKPYRVPLGKAEFLKRGKDITIIASSYMCLEALKAGLILDDLGVEADIINLRMISPLDEKAIFASVRKTGRILTVDGEWCSFGTGAEIIARVSEACHRALKYAPRRVAFPDMPIPTSWALSRHYYPRAVDIARAAAQMLGVPAKGISKRCVETATLLDIPDRSFTGPF